MKNRLLKFLALVLTLCMLLCSCAELDQALISLGIKTEAPSDNGIDSTPDNTLPDNSDENVSKPDNTQGDDNNTDDTQGGDNNTDDTQGGDNNTDDTQGGDNNTDDEPKEVELTGGSFNYSTVPEYTTENYYVVNGNVPFFTTDDLTTTAFELYGELDSLGRCTVAFACLARELMPTGTRPSISFEPTGWVQNRYPSGIVPQQDIYNRSHLIAWSLAGEGNNHNNLMTGTPYFNQIGMQKFENLVRDYINETGNHVLYRVTPIFVGDNLLANGALMEAYSVEDNGAGICFNVFMYNVQPGIKINYATGENELEKTDDVQTREPIYSNTFNTSSFGSASDRYSTYTADGWTITNASLLSAESMGADTVAAVLNGNTSKPGKLTSATISGGISKLAFDYGFYYKDTQVSLTVTIKQAGQTVASKTIDVSGLESSVAYSFDWVLDQAIEGKFTIEIVNNCKTGTAKNKDRVSIFNISWENA